MSLEKIIPPKNYKGIAIQTYIIPLIFLVYLLVIFEGVLRKWGFPQFEQIIFFIRFPFTLLIYSLVMYYKIWPKLHWALFVAYAFGIVSILLAIFQMIAGTYTIPHLIIVGYGWYNYFFFIPLACIIGEQFSTQDIQRFMKITLWIAIITVPILILQFNSSPKAVINQGSAMNEANLFAGLGSAEGYIRPAGFFTSALGQQMFVVGALVFVLYSWLQNTSVSKILQWVSTLAVLAMIGLSQNRGLLFQIAIFLIIALCAAFFSGQKNKIVRIFFWLTLTALFAGLIWPFAFPTAYRIFMLRWQSAALSENTVFQYGPLGRGFYTFYSFLLYLNDTPLFGYLFGISSNATRQLSWVQLPQAYYQWSGYGVWAEQPLSTHIVDMGSLVGLLFVGYRIVLAIWLGWITSLCTIRTHNPLPVLLFGFVGVLLLVGQITNHGTVTGFFWIFFGISLAVVRLLFQKRLKA